MNSPIAPCGRRRLVGCTQTSGDGAQLLTPQARALQPAPHAELAPLRRRRLHLLGNDAAVVAEPASTVNAAPAAAPAEGDAPSTIYSSLSDAAALAADGAGPFSALFGAFSEAFTEGLQPSPLKGRANEQPGDSPGLLSPGRNCAPTPSGGWCATPPSTRSSSSASTSPDPPSPPPPPRARPRPRRGEGDPRARRARRARSRRCSTPARRAPTAHGRQARELEALRRRAARDPAADADARRRSHFRREWRGGAARPARHVRALRAGRSTSL